MTRGRAGALLAFALVVPSLAARARIVERPVPHRIAPPPAHTGGFGEPTCHACHWDSEPGSGSASLELRGFPDTWSADRTYEIEIVLRRQDLQRAGFQLAVRYADGGRIATDAGVLRPGPGTALTRSGAAVTYLHHDESGTVPLWPDSTRWVVTWRAPRSGAETIALHIAANAANDDDSPLGDFIHALAMRSGRSLR
ncbi:MAG: hypothetical protein L0271_02405 [Gemmatimonadetes bacterium]|nr:hypothetical protein [Gemmatimonadota bacterium]